MKEESEEGAVASTVVESTTDVELEMHNKWNVSFRKQEVAT